MHFNIRVSYLTVLCIFMHLSSYSQNNTFNPTNFFDIQKQADEYYSNHPPKDDDNDGDGNFVKYQRWKEFWESRLNPDGTFPREDLVWKEWKSYLKSHSTQKAPEAHSNWKCIGPFGPPPYWQGTQASGDGRALCIAFHPTQHNTFWIGTPAGGLWKTTDGGKTWLPQTDSLPVLGVSSIAIAPNNPNIIYIATGDGDMGSFSLTEGMNKTGDTRSIGIMKSKDGGITWDSTGMNWSVTQQKLIRQIVLCPNKPDTILVAASDGIYKSVDSGRIFTNVEAGYFIDIAYNTSNPQHVYATSYDQGGNAQLFRSDDGGDTWTQVTSFNGYSRIKLGVFQTNGAYIDALCANASSGNFGGLYRSTDSGYTFSLLYSSHNANLLGRVYNGSDSIGQGWFDLSYAASPVNPNYIFLGGINVWRSTDSGHSWINKTMPYSGSGNPHNVAVIHTDYHDIVFDPDSTNVVFACNDGGLYKSEDSGISWTNLTYGIAIGEMYRVSVSQTDSTVSLVGLRDNGALKLSANGEWSVAHIYDGADCLIDYTDTNNMFVSIASGAGSGFIYSSNDAFNSNDVDISANILGGQQTGPVVTSIVMNPLDPKTIYTGYTDVYESNNRGAAWYPLSSNLTGGSAYYLHTVVIAPNDTNTIYAAKPYGIYYTSNHGTSWSNITGTLPLNPNTITCIAVSSGNPQLVWVTIGGFSAGEKVYMSTNAGTSWINISGSLPNIPIDCIIHQNNSNGVLYVGTDMGVFYRDSTLSDWQLFSNNMPSVIVAGLDIQYSSGILRAATFGRGLWQTKLATLINSGTTQINNTEEIKLYPNPSNGIFDFVMTNNHETETTQLHIEVYNILGKIVFSCSELNPNFTINLTSQPNGVYLYRILNNDAMPVSIGKLVKE